MIIQSIHNLKVGEIVHNGPVTGADKVSRPLTFQVLRTATEKEFCDYCADQGVEPNYHRGPNFYLVSAD